MKPRQEAERLLLLAYADRNACVVLAKAENISQQIICFHAQQAIEKALKAVLLSREVLIRRTHDLSECAYQVQDLGFVLPIPVKKLSSLTPYAVIGRYGGIEDDIISINEAIDMMTILLAWASECISSNCQ